MRQCKLRDLLRIYLPHSIPGRSTAPLRDYYEEQYGVRTFAAFKEMCLSSCSEGIKSKSKSGNTFLSFKGHVSVHTNLSACASFQYTFSKHVKTKKLKKKGMPIKDFVSTWNESNILPIKIQENHRVIAVHADEEQRVTDVVKIKKWGKETIETRGKRKTKKVTSTPIARVDFRVYTPSYDVLAFGTGTTAPSKQDTSQPQTTNTIPVITARHIPKNFDPPAFPKSNVVPKHQNTLSKPAVDPKAVSDILNKADSAKEKKNPCSMCLFDNPPENKVCSMCGHDEEKEQKEKEQKEKQQQCQNNQQSNTYQNNQQSNGQSNGQSPQNDGRMMYQAPPPYHQQIPPQNDGHMMYHPYHQQMQQPYGATQGNAAYGATHDNMHPAHPMVHGQRYGFGRVHQGGQAYVMMPQHSMGYTGPRMMHPGHGMVPYGYGMMPPPPPPLNMIAFQQQQHQQQQQQQQPPSNATNQTTTKKEEEDTKFGKETVGAWIKCVELGQDAEALKKHKSWNKAMVAKGLVNGSNQATRRKQALFYYQKHYPNLRLKEVESDKMIRTWAKQNKVPGPAKVIELLKEDATERKESKGYKPSLNIIEKANTD